jgi:glucan phosphoethanolaminetransferase (alkaline phosphatase superfamily)
MKTIITEPKVIIGFCLVIIGWVLPLLMVMQVIQASFFLCFLAYTASLVGLFLGVIGTASAVAYLRLRNKDDQRNLRK